MKEYIRFINDDYHEVITLHDDEVVPQDLKELIYLNESDEAVTFMSENAEAHNFVKFIILQDKVFFQFLDECSDKSFGNIRIIPLNQPLIYVDMGDDLKTPTEEIQATVKEFIDMIPQTNENFNKIVNKFMIQNNE